METQSKKRITALHNSLNPVPVKAAGPEPHTPHVPGYPSASPRADHPPDGAVNSGHVPFKNLEKAVEVGDSRREARRAQLCYVPESVSYLTALEAPSSVLI